MLACDRGVAALTALAPEWEPLQADHPFTDNAWFAAWWDAFGGSARLEVHTARRDGELVAALPVARTALRASVLSNYHSPIFEVPARDNEALAAVLDAAARSVSELAVHAVPDPSPTAVALTTVGRALHAEPAHTSPSVETTGDVDAYIAGLGSTVRRRRRKLEREHDVVFTLDAGAEDLAAELARGFLVEASGWKGEGGTAILSRSETESFYTTLAEHYRSRGELVLGRLEADGQLIAWHMCLRRGGRLYMLKTGFLDDWRKLAPGVVLHTLTIERCFERGEQAYDMLGDADAYKLEFANAQRRHLRAFTHSRSPAGLALRFRRGPATAIVRRLRALR